MREKNTELVESLHQFIAISKLIGKSFPEVDGTDRPGLAISWVRTPVSIHVLGTELNADGTIMNPTRVDWEKGAASVTPPGYWHEHVNESGFDTFVIPIQDAGLDTYLRAHSISSFTARSRANNKPKATAVGLLLPQLHQ